MFYGKTQDTINVYGKITVKLLTIVSGCAITTVKNVNACNGNAKGGEENAKIYAGVWDNHCCISGCNCRIPAIARLAAIDTRMGSHAFLNQRSLMRSLREY